MLVEEFKRWIHSDLKSFLDEKETETLDNRLADNFTLTHKVPLLTGQILENHFTRLFNLTPVLVSNLVIQIKMLPKPNLLVKTKVTIPYLSLLVITANNQVILFLTVRFLKRKREKHEGLKPTGLTSLKLTPQSCVTDQPPVQAAVYRVDPAVFSGPGPAPPHPRVLDHFSMGPFPAPSSVFWTWARPTPSRSSGPPFNGPVSAPSSVFWIGTHPTRRWAASRCYSHPPSPRRPIIFILKKCVYHCISVGQ